MNQHFDAMGIRYNDVAAYTTRIDWRKKDLLLRAMRDADYMTFASGSAVRAFAEMTVGTTGYPKIICIGPVTAKEAEQVGLTVTATAENIYNRGVDRMFMSAPEQGVKIMDMIRRPRRLRSSQAIRDMVHEYDVELSDLIYPVFVVEGTGVKEEILSMPGIYHYSLDTFRIHLEEIWNSGVRAIIFSVYPNTRMRWAARPIIRRGLFRGPYV